MKDYSLEYYKTILHDRTLCDFSFPFLDWKYLESRIAHCHIESFKKYISLLVRDDKIITIILFGSTVKGEFDNFNSDFDHFILYDYDIYSLNYHKNRLINDFKNICPLIDPYPYSYKAFHKLKYNANLYIYPSLKNALIIYNKPKV